jgi:hypothetical protein
MQTKFKTMDLDVHFIILKMKKKIIALLSHFWKIIVNNMISTKSPKNQIMKNLKFNSVFFVTTFLLTLNIAMAQGISRSSGFGIRASIWKPHNLGGNINVGAFPVTVTVGSGEGGYLYYYTRLKENWYLETLFGGTGNVVFTKIGSLGTYSLESSVVPLLFGARNDFLSLEHGSMFQPYWSLGGGLHWISLIKSNVVQGVDAKVGSDTQLGLYIGTGINALLSSRFALNADLKYHLVEFNPNREYSGIDYSFGVTYMWGDNPEIFRVEDIKVIVQNIYPSYYQFYNTYPLALVSVKNMVSYPIEVNIIADIKGFSERSQESGFKKINPGQTEDIPVYAIFGKNLLYTSKREEAIIDMQLEARSGATQSKTVSVNVIIHSRNAWNGEINRLKYFLTPDDEEIINYSRQILENNPKIDQTQSKNFKIAQTIFNTLSDNGLHYLSDPNIPYYKDDFVQYANETIEKGTGDCDDLVILYSSLLESVGIKTAFVEVKDPEKEIAHLYLIFDTGLRPDAGHQISTNDKLYIIRKNSIWIPLETTLIQKGFQEAWKSGAMSYLQEGKFRSGLTQGWVNIIDIH